MSVSCARAAWAAHQADDLRGQRGEAGRRAAEQPALGEGDAELRERGELGLGLDALGQQPGVDPAGELAEHLGQGHAHRVGVGVADQGAVELDHLRAQRGELLQPGVAAAGVVQGDQRTARRAARRTAGAARRGRAPGCARSAPRRRGAGPAGRPGRPARAREPRRCGLTLTVRNVSGGQVRDGGQRLVDGERLELGGDPGLGGGGEPDVGAGGAREPGQRLVAGEVAPSPGRRSAGTPASDRRGRRAADGSPAAGPCALLPRRSHRPRPGPSLSGRPAPPRRVAGRPGAGVKLRGPQQGDPVSSCKHVCRPGIPAGADGRSRRGRAWPRRTRRRAASPTCCTTASAWLPPAGCWSRCPARLRSTGCRGWPPGSSTPGTPRSPCSPIRTPSSAATACPPGVVGGPALLTGALSAIVVRQGAPLSVPDARADERRGRPAGGDVRPGAGLPRLRRSWRRPGTWSAPSTVYDPEPHGWTDDETEAARGAGRLRGGGAGALRRPLRGGHVGHPAERGAGGQLDRHLGTGPADRRHRHGRALRGALRPRRAPPTSSRRTTCRRGSCTATTSPRCARPCSRRWRAQRPVHRRSSGR